MKRGRERERERLLLQFHYKRCSASIKESLLIFWGFPSKTGFVQPFCLDSLPNHVESKVLYRDN